MGFTRGVFFSFKNLTVWGYSQSLAHNRGSYPEMEWSPVLFAQSVLFVSLSWTAFALATAFSIFYVSVSWKTMMMEPGTPPP